MATEIKVPTLGESVTEATVAQWLKQPGDAVAADEPVVELETDKVTLEVNAPAAGVLQEAAVGEGDTVEVGALLGTIGEGNGKAAAPAAAPAEGVKKEPAPAPASTPASGGADVEIAVPALGESVTEATVAQWLKQPGDAVKADDPLVELETDKVTLEVNAPAAGVLKEATAEAGSTVEVGALLGILSAGASGGATAAPSGPTDAAKDGETGGGSAPGRLDSRGQAPGDSDSALPPAASADLDPSAAPRSGEGGKITAADLKSFLESASGPSAMTLSPAVAKMIADKDLNANRIQGSGPQGRITVEDVQRAIDAGGSTVSPPAPSSGGAAAQAPAPAATRAPASRQREERVKMPKLRQTIARRLKEAQNTAAMLTTFNEADMTEVMALRAQYKDSFEKKHGVKLGFSSFFTKAVVKALQELPAVNARIEGEEIVYNHFYDIGMAVSTPNGLMVPVVRDCDQKSFAEIESSLGDLAKRGRDGKLGMDEMTGGTFTITNGGVFGSMMSTPILNMPQSAILGLHKIQERPMAVKGEVKIRPMMYLALSYDHRIIDGREAVTFLVRVKDAIEDPHRLLLDM